MLETRKKTNQHMNILICITLFKDFFYFDLEYHQHTHLFRIHPFVKVISGNGSKYDHSFRLWLAIKYSCIIKEREKLSTNVVLAIIKHL